MKIAESVAVKRYYRKQGEAIWDKRYRSPYPTRRYVHKRGYFSLFRYLNPADGILLDAGCGEGVFSCLAACRGYRVVALDLSFENVRQAYRRAQALRLKIYPVVADVERIPFQPGSFRQGVCSQVLEHLPDIDAGLKELQLVSEKMVVALPTCLNLCAAALLGGGQYWLWSVGNLLRMWWGVIRISTSLWRVGVHEGYGGHKELPHTWYFPWKFLGLLRRAGWRIENWEAVTLALPFLGEWSPRWLRFNRRLDRWKRRRFFRNFGFGSIAWLRGKENRQRALMLYSG